MPPPAVKTIKDLIFWQYSKIIADSAGVGKKNYGFVMNRFKKLQKGEIEWSTAIREYVKENEIKNKCIYCGKKKDKLTLEHLLPLCRGGPDISDNAVRVCSKCNCSKGGKRLYEWYLDKENMQIAKYKVPRIAEGKYLKLLYELHKSKGTLKVEKKNIKELCEICDLMPKCPEKTKLTVLCLEGIFGK